MAVSKDPAATWSAANGEFRTQISFSEIPGDMLSSGTVSSTSVSSFSSSAVSGTSTSMSQPSSPSSASAPDSSTARGSSTPHALSSAAPWSATSPFVRGASVMDCPLARALAKKLSPTGREGQSWDAPGLTTTGGARVDRLDEAMGGTSSSVMPAASRISSASSSRPFLLAAK